MDLGGVEAQYVALGLDGAWRRTRSLLDQLPGGRWLERVETPRDGSWEREHDSQDALARSLLVDLALAGHVLPPLRSDRPAHPVRPGPAHDATLVGGPPAVAWSRALDRGSSAVGAPAEPWHDGIAVVVDTGALAQHGASGVLLLTGVSTGTGLTLWEQPLPVVRRRTWSVVPGVVLGWDETGLQAHDTRDGTLRWRRAWNREPTVVGLRGQEVLVQCGFGTLAERTVLHLATGESSPVEPTSGATDGPAFEAPLMRVDPARGLAATGDRPTPPPGGHWRGTFDVAGGRLWQGRPGSGTASVMLDPDGTERWRHPDSLRPVARRGGLVVMQREVPAGRGASTDNRGIVVVDDAGIVRWSHPQGYARVAGDEIWYTEGSELVGRSLADGTERWRTPADLGGPRRLSFDEVTGLAQDRERGVPLVVAREQLVAYR